MDTAILSSTMLQLREL